jgi:hypothetical protein
MSKTVMDSTRAMAISGAMTMQWQQNVQWQCNSNARLVVIFDIEIEDKEIAHE